MIQLTPQALTPKAFAPFGDVIECRSADTTAQQAPQEMNDARFSRFDALAQINVQGQGVISLARCEQASTLPYQITLVERHPLGSQAFIPLSNEPMMVVVAAAGDRVSAADLHAFVSNGSQGINYHRGTWHMPLIAFSAGQTFAIVDTNAPNNCDELTLSEPVQLLGVSGDP